MRTENSQNIACPGIRLACSLALQYGMQTQNRLEILEAVLPGFLLLDIPIAYYSINATTFSGHAVIQRSNPFMLFFVAGTRCSYSSYIGCYITSLIGALLSDKASSQIATV